MRKLAFALAFVASANAAEFNATTSIVQELGAAVYGVTKTTTVCAWVYARGNGENNQGYIFVGDESAAGTSALRMHHTANANEVAIVKGGTVSSSNWLFAVPDNKWNSICYRYDWSSDANDPVVRVNSQAATLTTDTNPSGGTGDPALGYAIGNISAGSRTWNGQIMYVQTWNGPLTDAEMDYAAKNPCALRISSGGYQMRLCVPGRGGNDWVNQAPFTAGATPTATDVLPGTSAPPVLNQKRILRKIP